MISTNCKFVKFRVRLSSISFYVYLQTVVWVVFTFFSKSLNTPWKAIRLLILFLYRWLYSTNAKDIGTIYLVFATFSGLLGLAFSIIIRIELAAPGAQLLSGHNQLFNAVITAHGLLIVFFLVMIFSLFNILNTSKFNKYIIIIYFHFLGNKIFLRKLNSLSKNKNNKPPYDFTKIEIENCFINRKIIAINAKKAVGVYVFKSENGSCYVGSSISLYNRVCSYFIPSILAKGDRRVLRFFHKYSFKNVHLTLYIINESATAVQAIELEQYFIDTLSPDLNVDLIVSSSGYHEPISIK